MKHSLFRSVRHKLLNEGKLLRYLSYAVGEVVLIIVGILMALKINDWNEDRKARVEFDAYIVQLRQDVREAIENVESSRRLNERYQSSQEYTLTFLKLSEYKAEELRNFEIGLNNLGNYSELQIFIGLLGQLLNGKMETIGLDPALAKKAMDMESHVKRRLSLLSHLYNQLDLASDRLHQYRGKGSWSRNIPPTYDLEYLTASREFAYLSHSINNRMGTLTTSSDAIIEALESFLTTLEEYE